MPIKFNEEFNVSIEDFQKTGAFNTIIDMDSRVFIDPAMLKDYAKDEFENAYVKVKKYFSNIILLLDNSKSYKDMFWKKADQLLTFKELTGTCFGYSAHGTDGNSIGRILRKSILTSIKELIRVGEKDPIIFELLGAFQEKIGCDRVSDLLTYILSEEITSYTQRVLEDISLPVSDINYNGVVYKTVLNKYNGKPIMLLPSDILTPLPVADSFDDIDTVCSANQRVRDDINAYLDLGNRKKLKKAEIHQLLERDSDFRRVFIQSYKNMSVSPYNFSKDPKGEYIWYEASKEYAGKYPITIVNNEINTTTELLELIQIICDKFRCLIEDNGLWSLLYDDTYHPKHERAAQLLFFGIADAYCEANNIKISRECNNGRGPVDFSISKGYNENVLVEIKLSSSKKLVQGFENQLPIYMRQEKTKKALYLIVDVGYEKAVERFRKLYNSKDKCEKEKIKCIFIDGKRQRSASTVK